MKSSLLSAGIDLGTTNCAATLFYEDGRQEPVKILQPISETEHEEQVLLPSFLYKKPDGSSIVGAFARYQLGYQPGRVVQSAKSWLAHQAVSAGSAFLPFGSEDLEPGELTSPIAASSEYLRVIRLAIENQTKQPLREIPQIVITVPASFDELACTHTLHAAKLAGFPEQIRLLEEPQAALYRIPPEELKGFQHLLVCDIGGGTADFSLFKLISSPGRREPSIERVRIGEHLLLGGDNIDLEICSFLQARFQQEGVSLNRTQLLTLQAQSRELKERVFAGGNEELIPVSVVGAGSSLFSQAASVRVTTEAIRSFVLARFFPQLSGDSAQAGRMQFGLPYPLDTRFTAHLSSFLSGTTVDAVLFVGGTMTPAVFRNSLLSQIETLQGSRPQQVTQGDYDLSVSVGAAIFGAKAIRQEERIRSGQVRSFYLKLPDGGLLCVLPFGVDEGESLSVMPVGGQLMLRVNSPVTFELYSSLTRLADQPGERYDLEPSQFQSVGPLNALLSLSGRESRVNEIPVNLLCGVNDLGRLELSLVNLERDLRWRLEFGLKEGERVVTRGGGRETEGLKKAKALITQVFGKGKLISTPKDAKSLLRKMEEALGEKREEWSALTLRSLWSALEPGMTRRERSREHESTWLMMAGYLLRPGVGVELDGERVSRLWRVFSLGLNFSKEKICQLQWALMWRRVSLGLSAEQQHLIFDSISSREKFTNLLAQPEIIRLLASLERVSIDKKIWLVNQLISARKGEDPLIDWCLSRVLTRYPLSGSVETQVPAKEIERIVQTLTDSFSDNGLEQVLVSCCRITPTTAHCVSDEIRNNVKSRFSTPRLAELVDSTAQISTLELNKMLGESLPLGIRLL